MHDANAGGGLSYRENTASLSDRAHSSQGSEDGEAEIPFVEQAELQHHMGYLFKEQFVAASNKII